MLLIISIVDILRYLLRAYVTFFEGEFCAKSSMYTHFKPISSPSENFDGGNHEITE